jgi:hypothetical protein
MFLLQHLMVSYLACLLLPEVSMLDWHQFRVVFVLASCFFPISLGLAARKIRGLAV